jgi:hypothetical protein
MPYVRSYFNTQNIGDTIQTYALARLLPGASAWQNENDKKFVVNGWLGRNPVFPSDALYAGVYIAPTMSSQYYQTLKNAKYIIGCRDPHTLFSLLNHQIPAELVGCATLTLPRYEGHRQGELHIDDYPQTSITNLNMGVSWEQQWELAIQRLNELRSATIVFTTRLHVVLPCLAFGTPVSWNLPNDKPETRERFSLLKTMGVKKGLVKNFDVKPWYNRFTGFLIKNGINVKIDNDFVNIPIPGFKL